jgi:hypothetical protein
MRQQKRLAIASDGGSLHASERVNGMASKSSAAVAIREQKS